MLAKKLTTMKKSGTIARISLIAVFSTIALIFTGCSKNDDNIVETLTTDSNGYADYYLNNSARCGYTLYIATNTLSAPLADSIQTNVIKVSGYAYDWQGIFFNYADGSDFLAVLINTQGSYILVKLVAGTAYYYNGSTWISSNTAITLTSVALNLGYNAVNVIKVKITDPNTYALSFNDTEVLDFTETELTTGLYKGFLFTIDSKANEGFPDSFLEVKFKEIAAI